MKKRDGIKEILKSGQAPGCIIRGDSKQKDNRAYRPEQRTLMPREAERRGVTPDQYERIQEASCSEAEKQAAEVAALRKNTRRRDGELRHIGSVPAAEYYAAVQRDGTDAWHGDANEVKGKLKERGRLFRHEK